VGARGEYVLDEVMAQLIVTRVQRQDCFGVVLELV
jgi:hypothetical protein